MNMSKEQKTASAQGSSSTRGDFAREWPRLRQQVKGKWPQLTQDDLEMVDGDARKLSALVHQRTGAELRDIEREVESMMHHEKTEANYKNQSTEKNAMNEKQSNGPKALQSQQRQQPGQQLGQQLAGEKSKSPVSDTTEQASQTISEGYRQVERQLSAAPITSTSVAFATGAIIGWGLASVWKDLRGSRRSRHSWYY
jgi:hypothetical protein